MPKKNDIKAVAVVVAGVMIAGFIMQQFRDVGVVSNARDGFGA